MEKYSGITSSTVSMISGCGFSTIRICNRKLMRVLFYSIWSVRFSNCTGLSISQNFAIHNNCRWSCVKLFTGSSNSFGKFETACQMWKRCSTVDKLLIAVLLTFKNVLPKNIIFVCLLEQWWSCVKKESLKLKFPTWSMFHKLVDFSERFQ